MFVDYQIKAIKEYLILKSLSHLQIDHILVHKGRLTEFYKKKCHVIFWPSAIILEINIKVNKTRHLINKKSSLQITLGSKKRQ